MKIKMLALALLASCALAFSQPADVSRDEEGLEKVCGIISSHKITKGDFRQLKFIHKLKREMVSSGIFLISSDDGILWQTQKPYFSTMVVTQKAIIQTNSKGKKSVLSSESNPSFEQFSKVISSVFTGKVEILKENFDVEFIGSSDSWNINLLPQNSTVRNVVSEIEMAGHDSIDSMVIHEPSGDYIRHEFLSHIYPERLSDEDKAFFDEK